MATTPYRILLFLLGAVIAGGAAYYFAGTPDPAADRQAGSGGATAAPEAAATQARVPSGEGAESEKPETGPAASEQATQANEAAKQQVVVPSFHLLRAEPDGSLVVAGAAAPDAEVEILSGATVLATTKAGPTGDFAAILDKPLKPGEHDIVLRATAPDNVVATSMETAIVSIPSAGSSEVVALVQQPGEPSRLISVPNLPGKGPAQTENESAPAASGKPAEPETHDEAGSHVAEALGAQDDAAETADRTDSGKPKDIASAEDARREVPEIVEAPEAAPGDGASGQAVSSAPDQPANEAPGVVARAETDAAGQAAQPQPSNNLPFIEAVEIDGREVFVAGRAEPGRLLRVYANDILLDQTRVSPEGRFLVEAERDLPVGDYIIRADVLADDGVTVVARAAVPFERPEGEQIAAVAPAAMPRQADDMPQAGGGDAQEDNREDRESSGAQAVDGATQADAFADEQPAAGGNAAAQSASSRADEGAVSGESSIAQSSASREEQTQSASAGGFARPSDQGGVAVTSPRLQPVEGAVIIRRGDTLWQISRRVYGRGIRYTTIYLANQDQIRDPDLIWPGQIFTIPNETEEGVKADLEAIGNQAITPEKSAAADPRG
ncbi:LysM peptidoglycan-binding domain-containing protein [Chelativorans sp. SCAU2101]|uniref:LysM peptidoglycan-binding domain-containing protein n=1 Tax=Chelativorans petroleitrophicus TaxID=2975484 RepID=A0A9X3AZY0_9HYPH|nr:LysM peptidoglycan-binding domain-containing protein [Chelativorans petroleitrophicus]MCT8990890.1 LysM peptidoglycan-binding domain-containing protein [Chelativorans petroleitrophicus]